MVTVVFYLTDWEQYPGADSPKNSMYVWLQDVKAFNVDRIIMIDITSFKIGNYYNHTDEEIIFEKYNTLDECIEKYSDQTWVFLKLSDDSTSLTEFNHPKDCFYVVGGDFTSISTSYEPTYKVTIPMINRKPLYAHVAMMIVLYDRTIKNT